MQHVDRVCHNSQKLAKRFLTSLHTDTKTVKGKKDFSDPSHCHLTAAHRNT